MPLDKRISDLEAALPARCPTCRTQLTCPQCQDWKQEARALGLNPEEIVDRLYKEIVAQLEERRRNDG